MEDEVRRAGLGPEVVAHLAHALEAARALVVELTPEAWSAPSPCPGWDARDVVNHLAAVSSKFTRFASGDDGMLRQAQGDLLGREPAAGFTRIVGDSSAAWADNPSALTRVCQLPFGRFDGTTAAGINLFDAVVHGWDVASAAGVEWDLDEGAILAAVAVCDLLVTPEARAMGQFGKPLPNGDTPMQVLLARTGRGDAGRRPAQGRTGKSFSSRGQ